MGCSNSMEREGGGEGGAAPIKDEQPEVDLEVRRDDRLLDKYKLGKIIGQGAFGIVYSCKRMGSNEEYAVKMIDQVETPLQEIKQEVDMLQKLAHPCVVRIVDVYYEKVFVCMVMEIYKGGDMIEGMQLHWKARGQIPIPVIQNLSKMMVQGVDYLHEKASIHRDLKGDNFLTDVKNIENPSCRVFLSDFGTVIELAPGQRLRQKCGTKTYWSPEFYALNYSFPVDVWALGVIIFGLVTGRFPFKGEEDARSKNPKIPGKATKDGQSFLQGTLIKNESERFTARQAIQHKFLSSIKSAAEVAEEVGEEEKDQNFEGEIREQGPNAGIKDRRRELVERLEDVQERKKDEKTPPTLKTPKQAATAFDVENKRNNKINKFDWWSGSKVVEKGFVDMDKAMKPDETNDMRHGESNEEDFLRSLKEHQISTDRFGQGEAKTLKEFMQEVQHGQSRLMLDATKHKNMVRVVDVVLLRICHTGGSSKRYLIKQSEKFPDGRLRDNIWQLPGQKQLPHDNAIQTCERAVKERLHLDDSGIVFDFDHIEIFEDDEDSPSYPGVRTVYRKQIYEGRVTTTNAQILKKMGLASRSSNSYTAEGANKYVRKFMWLTEKECRQKGLRLHAPKQGSEISSLVQPPVGFSEDELRDFFQANNVDTSRFGKDGVHSLSEMAEELMMGESALSRQADGRIIRVVDLVILMIKRKDGCILVETEEIKEGNSKKKERLPAVKRRADENPFWAAHRCINKTLKISDNALKMDAENVLMIEEESPSKAYADLPTLYRRRIIQASLAEA